MVWRARGDIWAVYGGRCNYFCQGTSFKGKIRSFHCGYEWVHTHSISQLLNVLKRHLRPLKLGKKWLTTRNKTITQEAAHPSHCSRRQLRLSSRALEKIKITKDSWYCTRTLWRSMSSTIIIKGDCSYSFCVSIWHCNEGR